MMQPIPSWKDWHTARDIQIHFSLSSNSICWFTRSWSICERYSNPGGTPATAVGAGIYCGGALAAEYKTDTLVITFYSPVATIDLRAPGAGGG